MFDGNGAEITYDIYAENPDGEKPTDPGFLKNYVFALKGANADEQAVVGTLKLTAKSVAAEDYDLNGSNVCWKSDSKDSLWIRQNSTFVVSDNNTSLQVKNAKEAFNAVYFYSDDKGSTQIDSDIDISSNAEKELYFRLVSVDNENHVKAWSEAVKITVTPDSTVEGAISVTANSGNKSFTSLLLDTLTFGLFGNRDNTSVSITGSDEQSRIASIQYSIEDYEDMQAQSDWKSYCDNKTDWMDLEIETSSEDESTFEGKFSFEDDGRRVVLAKITDRVGNITYVGSNGIVVDSVAGKSNAGRTEGLDRKFSEGRRIQFGCYHRIYIYRLPG